MKKVTILAVMLMFIIAACSSEADVASENLSKAAEQFEIDRRVVFMNGITDEYMLSIEGRCSIENSGTQLSVTCKTDEGFKKHYLGLSDNVTFFVEQLMDADVGTGQYRVIFRPSAIIPDIDME